MNLMKYINKYFKIKLKEQKIKILHIKLLKIENTRIINKT